MNVQDLYTFIDLKENITNQCFTYALEYAELTEFKGYTYLENVSFDYVGDNIFTAIIVLDGTCYSCSCCEGEYYHLQVPALFIFGDDNDRAQIIKEYNDQQEAKLQKELEEKLAREKFDQELKDLRDLREYERLKKKYESSKLYEI